MNDTPVLIALGSNLGERAGFLLQAVSQLSRLQGLRPELLSSLYETEPVGPAGQGPYLNAVLLAQTSLPARELLREMLQIESRLGRVRGERWGPRTIDLDLLDYAGQVIDEPGLRLPHPRLHQRPFVLAPLAEAAPGWRHPLLHKTARELLQGLDASGVRRWRVGY